MKLVIQIPCFNEEDTLPLVFEKMPRTIPGIDTIEYQIIDDCSTDRTVEIAESLGIDHIVRIKGKNRRWLGRAFCLGIENALRNGADIVVNTDGDNQYPSELIPELIRPIIEGKADIVIGDRHPGDNKEFSALKRFLQICGSKAVQLFAGETIPDAVSGFRAFSRSALLKIHVLTNFTYTVDTLMQAHKKGLAVSWIPIPTNKQTRPSRLIKSIFHKVRKSGLTILRLATVYTPLRIFGALSAVCFAPSLFYLGRFVYFYFFVPELSSRHIQSLIVSASLLAIAVQLVLFGIIGELLAVNRSLLEDMLTRVKTLEFGNPYNTKSYNDNKSNSQALIANRTEQPNQKIVNI